MHAKQFRSSTCEYMYPLIFVDSRLRRDSRGDVVLSNVEANSPLLIAKDKLRHILRVKFGGPNLKGDHDRKEFVLTDL